MKVRNFEANERNTLDYVAETNTYRAFYLSTHPSESGRRGFESRSGQKPIFRMGVLKGKNTTTNDKFY